MQKISKIVLTGGPCAGKTTAMSWIQNEFTNRGYKVLFIPETASELITGGVAPWTCDSNTTHQCCQMDLQAKKEEVFMYAAKSMPQENVLIVCDRGMMDNRAYMTDEEYAAVLEYTGKSEVEIRDNYDAVFHLVTAANGTPEAYEKNRENNPARTETLEQAIDLDNKLIAAWTGHPYLRVINNDTDFEGKMHRLIAEITSFLGEPDPFEIERKYLIKYPDAKALEAMEGCKKIDIHQTYLKSSDDKEIRIRARGMDGSYIYFKTIKQKVNDTTRIEMEERLSREEYFRLIKDADPEYNEIRKTRYCLAHEGQYFEIDIFPFWDDKAILEIDLLTENQPVIMPDFVEVIKEVTRDENYKNRAFARTYHC